MVMKDHTDHQVSKVLEVKKDPMEIRDLMEMKDQQVMKDQWVMLELMDQQDLQVSRDHKAQ